MPFKKHPTILVDEKSNHPYRLIIGCLVFVLTLVLTGTLAINHFISTFGTDIHENMVFEVNLTGIDGSQHQSITMSLQQTINATPGVKESAIIPLHEGDMLVPSTLFIEVRVNPTVPVNGDEILLKLRQILPSVHMQSHKFIQANLLYLQKTLLIFSYALIALIATTIIVAISLITRSGLRVHRGVIDILRLIGAPNAYIARQFQWLAFKIGLSSSAMGIILGILIFYVMLYFGIGMPHHFAIIDQRMFLWFALMPFGIGLMSLCVARVEVLRTLIKLDA